MNIPSPVRSEDSSGADRKFGFSKRNHWLIIAMLAVGTLFLYWPLRSAEFLIFDDPDYVYENPVIKKGLTSEGLKWAFAKRHASNWHPLTWISHMIDVQLFGMNAGAHHLTNVAIHCANSVLLFVLLLRTTGLGWRSGFVAALFAWHPAHVESVAWISERKDVLSMLFLMLTLLSYVSYFERRSSGKPSALTYYVAAIGCFILGLLSKAMLVTVPVILFVFDFWPLRRVKSFRDLFTWQILREKIPFAVLAAASSVITFVAQRQGGSVADFAVMPLGMRISNALVSYVRYLGKLVWPSNLSIFYPLPLTEWSIELTFGVTLLLIVITTVAVGLRRKMPFILMGWFWFAVTLLPVCGLVHVGMQSIADRYTYIPFIGLFVLLVWWIAEVADRFQFKQALLVPVSALVLLACVFTTRSYLAFWGNSIDLFSRAISVTTNNDVAENNLAAALRLSGRTNEALVHFAEAVRIRPANPSAARNMGVRLSDLGRYEEALPYLELAARVNPKESTAQYFGLALSGLGKYGQSISAYRKEIQLTPNSPDALNNLAWLLASCPEAQFRNGKEAIELAKRACELTEYKRAIFIGTLAAAYAEAGEFDNAVATAERAQTVAKAAGETGIAARNAELAELYRAKKPYHEPARAAVKQ